MNKTVRYVLYVVIIIICVISIGIGVYDQFFKKEKIGDVYVNEVNNTGSQNLITEQDVKQSFLDLFTNELYSSYDETKISKIDSTKDIVYTAYLRTETVEGKYSIDLCIPLINIQGDLVNEYNNMTQTIFVDKINSIMLSSSAYTIYNLDYIAYVNNSILSVAIKATIKEGENPQRVIIQTYNYDLETGANVELQNIIENREIEKNVVESKIQNAIKKSSEDAEKMAESGYTVYMRNLNDEIYKLENIKTFMQGPNGELYIIFAYGNNNYTSEMDIIEI